ncbi:hypothetical protein H8Z72_22585 (plasmid) [Xanthomonas citri pv. citri]|uniref:hypothetical protein n=1 Tax=Xanthomonas citri TaxID=346 RepID=UPI0019313DEA|nr:hypothetical protein [Xanthomonas citri]QRD62682.1 hypothetical protein H8Z74_23600 [Xanthomonas citri pv. citri]QRD67217.1 hypothetical protein H8Z73_22580 [Xanthomonas citri pv. citri]QRD71738.1 hypothetical protein H8Z72_22585 [Xanthomonas citri pv. citri]
MTETHANSQRAQFFLSDAPAFEALRNAERQLLAHQPISRAERNEEAKRLTKIYAAEQKSRDQMIAVIGAVAAIAWGVGIWLFAEDDGLFHSLVYVLQWIAGVAITCLIYALASSRVRGDYTAEAWSKAGPEDLVDPTEIERLSTALEGNEKARIWAQRWQEKTGRISVEDARILNFYIRSAAQVEVVIAAREKLVAVLQTGGAGPATVVAAN